MPLEPQALQKLMQKVKGCVERGDKLNEADTKAVLIEPLLTLLGWDVQDPAEVRREWRRKSNAEPLDYVLFSGKNKLLLVEAKSLNDSLKSDRGWRQVLANGLAANIKWCARMNGRRVVLVNPTYDGELESKEFWDLDLAKVDGPDGLPRKEVAKTLELMSKEAMVGKRLREAWEAHAVQLRARDAVDVLLCAPPAAWISAIQKAAQKEAKQPLLDETVIRSCLAGLASHRPTVSPAVKDEETGGKKGAGAKAKPTPPGKDATEAQPPAPPPAEG